MKHTIFFDSILVFQDNSWLHNLNKFTEDYIIKSRNENKKQAINNRDFGFSNHSLFLSNDKKELLFIFLSTILLRKLSMDRFCIIPST